MRPAWIEIDLEKLQKNIGQIKKLLDPDTKLMCVVKADGYGHGALPTAHILSNEGVDYFAVAILEEAIELRQSGIREPILILGCTLVEDLKYAIEYNLTLTVFNANQAKAINEFCEKLGLSVTAHIKIDTGMGRSGFKPCEASINYIAEIYDYNYMVVEGIYSHFATADNVDESYCNHQFQVFNEFLSDIDKKNIEIPLKHMANSAATIKYKRMHMDMVRVGLSLYGMYPDFSSTYKNKIPLLPIMTIKAKLAHVRNAYSGEYIGYGATYRCEENMKVGTIPIGYADGISRLLSNKGFVMINGIRCRIIGRVCMDQLMVDLRPVQDAKVGDEVILMGEEAENFISVDEVAAWSETINYEVATRMGKRIPRKYIGEYAGIV